MWEKNLKENGCVYMYNRIIWLYNRNDHNIVNQLQFNEPFKNEKKIEIYLSSVEVTKRKN